MIDNITLKNAIVTALGSQLGTYSFSNSLSTPAIRIDEGSNPYEEEPSVTGIEVIIQPSINVNVVVMFEGYKQDFVTLITLKQWDITKTTLEALGAMLEAIAQFDNLNLGQIKRQIRLTKLDNIEIMAIPVAQSFLTEFALD